MKMHLPSRSPFSSFSFASLRAVGGALAAATLALSVACPAPSGDDAGTDPDGGTAADAGPGGDDGGVDGGDSDAGFDAGPIDGGEDGGPPPVLDAGPDDSLADTPFADVTLRWAGDLDLCNAWQEGGALESEHARRVRVRLPRQPRASLGEQHLSQSTLADVSIERGVMANERWHSVAPVSSSVGEWEVTPPGGNITFWTLTAEVRHDFGAETGTVIERYQVHAFDGEPVADIVVGDPNSYGSNFSFLPAGADDLDAIFLVACEPSQETHLVVEALVGEVTEGPHSGRHFQVTRYVRTFDVFAGSYPVYWDATDVFFTDEPYAGTTVFGQWAHTYSAAHHNWDEASRVLPRNDVGAYHTKFAELDRGDGLSIEAISKVEWANVTSFAQPGTMTVTLQDLETGAESEHAVQLQTAFVDLSTRSLVRETQQECPDVEVQSIGGFAYGGVAG